MYTHTHTHIYKPTGESISFLAKYQLRMCEKVFNMTSLCPSLTFSDSAFIPSKEPSTPECKTESNHEEI